MKRAYWKIMPVLVLMVAAIFFCARPVQGIIAGTAPICNTYRTALWSPDGSLIALPVNPKELYPTTFIILDSRKGSIVYQSDEPDNLWPIAWSPDSTSLVIEAGSGSRQDFAIIDIHSGTLTRLGVPFVTGEQISYELPIAKWSPDGRQILASTGKGLFLVNPDASGYTLIADPGPTHELRPELTGQPYPDWSTDATQIAYAVRNKLWIVNADGSEPRTIYTGNGELGLVSWSPDGMRLAMSLTTRGTPALLIIRADGTEPRLIADRFGVRDYQWSPDSTLIGYRWNDITVSSALSVYDAESGEGRLGAMSVHQYMWLPDSSGVRFLSGDYYDSKVTQLDLDLHNETLLRLPAANDAYLSPDGRRVAYYTPRRHSMDTNTVGSLRVVGVNGGLRRKLTGHLCLP